MPICDGYDGPYGQILRPVRGCEACGCADAEPDADGLWCCTDCGMTLLHSPWGEGC